MEEERIELIKLQAMLDATSKIFKALCDGYNFSYMGLNFGEKSNIKEEEYLIWDIHISRTDKEYIKYINESIIEISDIESRVKENVFWSLEHLKTFNKIPEVFNNEFSYRHLVDLLDEFVKKLNSIIKRWDAKCFEYDIYAGERRVLVITEVNKIIILDILNDLH